ncbi:MULTISPECIES: DUF2971 domain-containing protein [unclassified Duganella]|uniref:DUF2971 domain-containing protein n=1 Tax=unclassified Duganella TaxID=2636909 RepID=UPI00158708CB|nr:MULTISPECIES: DUF2971 domain-containing protein [unclassified Duganella]
MKKIIAEQNEDLNNPFVQASYTAAVNQVRAFILQKSYPSTVGREFAKSMNQRQGVLSLSRTNNNILMWSHYADSHKGIVLGLDETHDFFSGVDRMGLKRPPRNVVYSTKRQLVKAGDTQAFEKLMCQKSLDWAYEEEVRLFRAFGTDEECLSFSPHQIHLFELPKTCIKQVYIGMNASTELRAAIIAIGGAIYKDWEIFDTRVSDEHYELVFTKSQTYGYRQSDGYWTQELLRGLGQ